MTGKRDNDYFIGRLKRDHPVIYRDLKDRKYKSVRAASIAAGIVSPRTPLHDLKRAWNAASVAEKRGFTAWASASSPVSAKSSGYFDGSGRLTAATRTALAAWITIHDTNPGRVMKQIGFSSFDYRLAAALRENKPLPLDVRGNLEPWLRSHGL